MEEINEKEKKLFMQYGTAASEAMLDFPCHFFQIPTCKGIIAYRIEFNCAIVIGDPMCPSDEICKITEAFHEYCKKLNLNIIYVIVSEKFSKYAKNFCPISIQVCEELIFNPTIDPCLKSHRLRHRVDKAYKHGLKVYEYLPFDKEIEKALQQVGMKWKEGIKGPNVYLGHLNFFNSYIGKRWFYIKDGEQITAMAMLSRLEAYQGWLLKFFVTLPNAFSDTSEFFMHSLLEILRKENCFFLTKGMVPVHSLDAIYGLGNFSMLLTKSIYNIISKVFRFKKRKEYWFRYHPKIEPAYLLLYHPRIGVNEIRALMKVFKTHVF